MSKLVAIPAVLLLLLACGGDDEEPAPAPAPAPVIPAPSPPPVSNEQPLLSTPPMAPQEQVVPQPATPEAAAQPSSLEEQIVQTRLAIRAGELAIERFDAEYARLPGSLNELVAPPPNGDRQPVFMDHVPLDAWEEPLVYRLPPRVSAVFDLYSTGPNASDEFGAGDDVVTNSVRTVRERPTQPEVAVPPTEPMRAPLLPEIPAEAEALSEAEEEQRFYSSLALESQLREVAERRHVELLGFRMTGEGEATLTLRTRTQRRFRDFLAEAQRRGVISTYDEEALSGVAEPLREGRTRAPMFQVTVPVQFAPE